MLDPLVLTVASDGQAPSETLNTLREYGNVFGYPTTMGLSNVSFGLPGREDINAAFYALALASGLNAPIINPCNAKIKMMTEATNVLLGFDKQGVNYSKNYVAGKTITAVAVTEEDVLGALVGAVMGGEKERAAQLTLQAFAEGHDPREITAEALVKGMNIIGDDFGAGRTFYLR